MSAGRRDSDGGGRLWALAVVVILAGFVLALVWARQRTMERQLGGSDALAEAIAARVEGQSGDVPGRDLPAVPRYRPSQRIAFAEQPATARQGRAYWLVYQCQGDLRTVSAYYEREMTDHGWALAAKAEPFLQMHFVRRTADGATVMAQMDFRPVAASETAVGIVITEATR